MYIALRAIKIPVLDENGQQKSVRMAEVGEEIPESVNWSYPVIISLLNLDHIKWKGDGVPTHNLHKGAVVDMAKYRKGATSASVEPIPATVAPEVEPLQCGACLKRFKNATGLKSHFRTKHTEASPGQAV